MRAARLLLLVVCLGLALPGDAFVHHRLVASKQPAGGAAWSNAYSCKLNGTTQAITLGQPANLTKNLSSSQFTVSAWFKTSTVDGQIVCKGNSAGYGYRMALLSGGAWLYVGDNNISGGSGYANGAWHHALVTIRASGAAQAYYDGVSVGTTTAGTQQAATIDTLIGARRASGNTGVDTPLNGNVDEITFWSTGFTAGEVASIYNSGHPADPTTHAQAANLISYYRCGDLTDSSTTVYDRSGSNTGTIIGSATYEASVP